MAFYHPLYDEPLLKELKGTNFRGKIPIWNISDLRNPHVMFILDLNTARLKSDDNTIQGDFNLDYNDTDRDNVCVYGDVRFSDGRIHDIELVITRTCHDKIFLARVYLYADGMSMNDMSSYCDLGIFHPKS